MADKAERRSTGEASWDKTKDAAYDAVDKARDVVGKVRTRRRGRRRTPRPATEPSRPSRLGPLGGLDLFAPWTNEARWPRSLASAISSSSSAPILCRSANSSRRRPHHLGPVRRHGELHLVLEESAEGLAHRILVASALVRRFDVGQISSVTPPAEEPHQLRVLGGEDPVADPLGPE